MKIFEGDTFGRQPLLPAMGRAQRILFVSAEAFPLAKTGGLADVCAALPKALARLGCDVRLLVPGYADALGQLCDPRVVAELRDLLPGTDVRLIAGTLPGTALPVLLVDCPVLYCRPGALYVDAEGHDWADNARRFAVLCHVAAKVALGRGGDGWRPDVVHAHDWHAGLVPLLLRRSGPSAPPSVFTIHNAAFQGNFPLSEADSLGLPADVLGVDGIEFYGQLSFLKAGVRFADKLTTVSPGYAREIQESEYGCGLEALFTARADDLTGIMNGIDTELWNPAADPLLPCVYSIDDTSGKAACKSALQHEMGLRLDAQAPLVASVCRLTHQKMSDVLLHALPQMLDRHPRLQVAIHGRGDRELEAGFLALAAGRDDGRLAVHIGYDEGHAHRLQAGADILLQGARFEPCGLTQLYAMRYGTIPIVTRIGGLADSVVDHDGAFREEGATGFTFDHPTCDALLGALHRCLDLYAADPAAWSTLCRFVMSRDSGWSRSAMTYLNLYGKLAAANQACPVAAVELPARAWTDVSTTQATVPRQPRTAAVREEREGAMPLMADGWQRC
ncbi:glycogen synthase GlgA [Burkholderia cepacia]|uniref:glycogen synthase GlgA n=1 Tax=Burkholderia cepacia TaxID=292 RepID=UPI001F2AB273|nr:glycogen synthase GlgA [Burkholderia cepacia]